MAGVRDAYCSYCGAPYPAPLLYPRRCPAPSCGVTVWANPIPVSVVLVPVERGGRTGLLVVRRSIEPQRGKLALVGGFAEEHETWQEAGAREIREETGLAVDPATLETFWFASTEPRPNRVLLFSVAAPLDGRDLAPLPPNAEVSERGLVFGSRGLDEVFAFPLHVRAARRWLDAKGLDGPHDFAAV